MHATAGKVLDLTIDLDLKKTKQTSSTGFHWLHVVGVHAYFWCMKTTFYIATCIQGLDLDLSKETMIEVTSFSWAHQVECMGFPGTAAEIPL